MMFPYQNHVPMNGWGWAASMVGTLLFAVLVVTVVVLVLRATSRHAERSRTDARPSPETLLAERFARGEIDDREYHERLAALRATWPSPHTKT